MITKPITELRPRERYTETTYGDGTDETYTLVSSRLSTLSEGYVHVTYIDATDTQARMITSVKNHVFPVPYVDMDRHGNAVAQEGCDRCACGCKYWENDRCIDCGTHVAEIQRPDED